MVNWVYLRIIYTGDFYKLKYMYLKIKKYKLEQLQNADAPKL